jgi:hypothetical protein
MGSSPSKSSSSSSSSSSSTSSSHENFVTVHSSPPHSSAAHSIISPTRDSSSSSSSSTTHSSSIGDDWPRPLLSQRVAANASLSAACMLALVAPLFESEGVRAASLVAQQSALVARAGAAHTRAAALLPTASANVDDTRRYVRRIVVLTDTVDQMMRRTKDDLATVSSDRFATIVFIPLKYFVAFFAFSSFPSQNDLLNCSVNRSTNSHRSQLRRARRRQNRRRRRRL